MMMVSFALLFMALGAYMMRWLLWDSCLVVAGVAKLAQEESARFKDRLTHARFTNDQLYGQLAGVQAELDEAGSYSYRLLEDPAYYESQREQFLSSYVPSAPPSDFYHNFDRN